VEELIALAKLTNNGGTVSVPYTTVARRSFVKVPLVKRVVADIVESGLIEDVGCTAKTISATFIKWSTWQPKDPTAAARKSRERAQNVT